MGGTTTVGERRLNALRVTSEELTRRKVLVGLLGSTGPDMIACVLLCFAICVVSADSEDVCEIKEEQKVSEIGPEADSVYIWRLWDGAWRIVES